MIPGSGNQSFGGPPNIRPLLGKPATTAPRNGLVRVMTNAEIQKVKDAETDTKPTPVNESRLAAHIRQKWERNKMYRQRTEQRLLKCLRARRGVYSGTEIAKMQQNGGLNILWHDLTETKCRAASAWIRDIIMPTGARAWGMDPTPLPDLPVELKNALVSVAANKARQAMEAAAQAGGGTMEEDEFKQLAVDIGIQMKDDLLKEYREKASKAAVKMEDKIEDTMDEGGYDAATDGFIENFVTYPAAILKGPFFKRTSKLKWLPGYKAGVESKPTQNWDNVSPFDCYPSPHTTTPQKGDFIERMRWSREDLHGYIGVPGYKEKEIQAALLAYHSGLIAQWLWTEAERQQLEQDSMYEWLSPAGMIDALHYWGAVPGWKLMSWGMTEEDVPDPVAEYEVDAVLIGQFVVRCEINRHPMKRRPYHKACFDEIPGAFWGRAIPDLCEPAQKMCNAIACSLADNLSISSGPQVWIHNDRLADGTQDLDMYPWKRWQLKSDPTQGVNPGIGFFQPQSNSAELLSVMEKWELRADDATGIPRYIYGNEHVSGAAGTASGLAMLMSSAAKGLRRAISSIDLNAIQPSVEDCFIYEMLYGEDKSIKGDCCVVARGAAAILVKENAQQKRLQALELTNNPVDMQIIGLMGRAELLRETLSVMELPVDKIIPDEATIKQKMDAMNQPPPPKPDTVLTAQNKSQMHDKTVAKDLAIAQMKHGAQGGLEKRPYPANRGGAGAT